MQLKRLQLKHFRCFGSLDLSFDEPIVIISGCNGSGKTSVLEALHYAGYLRSFRTHLPRELVQFDTEAFSIKVAVASEEATINEIAVGVSGAKKIIKLNQKSVTSYKELTDYYRIIAVTDDDLELIKGSPEYRRNYLDQALAVYVSDYAQLVRSYKTVLTQRNALLAQPFVADDLYMVLTEQLWRYSCLIAQQRKTFLTLLQDRVNALLESTFPLSYSIKLIYETKGYVCTDTVWSDALKPQELALKRSLFGAHLDDFVLSFNDKKTKSYASRGQQKLTILLLKIAQLQDLHERKGPVIVLLDDFMNDFDATTAATLLNLLKKSASQLIFTCPIVEGFLNKLLTDNQTCHIQLPS